MNANTHNLISVGRLCGRVNALPEAICDAASRAGIVPVMYLDGVPMFNVVDVSRIATMLSAGPAVQSTRNAQ